MFGDVSIDAVNEQVEIRLTCQGGVNAAAAFPIAIRNALAFEVVEERQKQRQCGAGRIRLYHHAISALIGLLVSQINAIDSGLAVHGSRLCAGD